MRTEVRSVLTTDNPALRHTSRFANWELGSKGALGVAVRSSGSGFVVLCVPKRLELGQGKKWEPKRTH